MPGDGQSLWDITGEFEHDWYIDSQKFKPGYVDPIGSVDFAVVPGVIGYHPLLTLLEAVRREVVQSVVATGRIDAGWRFEINESGDILLSRA